MGPELKLNQLTEPPGSRKERTVHFPNKQWKRFASMSVATLGLIIPPTLQANPALSASASQHHQAQEQVQDRDGHRHHWPRVREGDVPVSGGSLHYRIRGEGPAVTLLHGWPQTSHAWRAVARRLASSHTVIEFDLPGLGRSGSFSDGYDAATTASRIHEALQSLGYDETMLVGHDLGALVAYPFAKQFPSSVTRMVAIETPLNGFGLEQVYGQSFHFLLNAAAQPIPEAIIDDGDVSVYLGYMFASAVHGDRIDKEHYVRAYLSNRKRHSGFNYYRAFQENAEYNTANASTKIDTPVIGMGADHVFNAGVAESWKNVASDVRTVVVPDSGHFVPEEQSEFLATCLLTFADPNSTPGPGYEGCRY